MTTTTTMDDTNNETETEPCDVCEVAPAVERVAMYVTGTRAGNRPRVLANVCQACAEAGVADGMCKRLG